MFYYIRGALVAAAPDYAVLETGGIAYKMTVSQMTAEALPRPADGSREVKLYTYFSVREDGVELFGFADEAELYSFKLLLSVSGVGPKAAMSVLSLLNPEKLAIAVCSENKAAIAKANGIGPKTAARIILELKDKLAKNTPELSLDTVSSTALTATTNSGKIAEATDALLVLGFSRAEAATVLSKIDTAGMELEDIIRVALKNLANK